MTTSLALRRLACLGAVLALVAVVLASALYPHLAPSLGMSAALVALFISPAQAVLTVWHRKSPGILEGISYSTIIIFAVQGPPWILYALHQHAPWTLVNASVNMCFQLVVLAVCWRYGRFTWRYVAVCLLAVAAALGLSLLSPYWAIGAGVSILSAATFVPQAIRTWRTRGTEAALAYSKVTAWTIITANVLWLSYGIALRDFWIAACEPLYIASGALMLLARHLTRVDSTGRVTLDSHHHE